MEKFQIGIADLTIGVECFFQSTAAYCKDYLIPETKPTDFDVGVSEEDLVREKQKSMEECALEGLVYPNFTPAELEITAVYRKIAEILPKYQAAVFHGSTVAVGEEAYLFTALSGTGKTTHTNLWLKNIEGSYIVNGDKPIIRVKENVVTVYGTPWAGKEGIQKNVSVPLKAICLLNRGKENSIHAITLTEALPNLLTQCYRPADKASLIATIRLLDKIGNGVGLYSLSCNMEDEAAFVSYNGMK